MILEVPSGISKGIPSEILLANSAGISPKALSGDCFRNPCWDSHRKSFRDSVGVYPGLLQQFYVRFLREFHLGLLQEFFLYVFNKQI